MSPCCCYQTLRTNIGTIASKPVARLDTSSNSEQSHDPRAADALR